MKPCHTGDQISRWKHQCNFIYRDKKAFTTDTHHCLYWQWTAPKFKRSFVEFMRQFKVKSYSDKTKHLHYQIPQRKHEKNYTKCSLLLSEVFLPELAQWRALLDFSHAQVSGTQWMQFLGIISTGIFHLFFSTAGIVSALWISQREAEFKWSCLNEVMLLAVCSLKGWDLSSYIAMISSCCFPGGSLMALPGWRH